MNDSQKQKHPIALTIAGSDCSGGAGLEADLKVFAEHKVYGMAVVTNVVAENPNRVTAIHPVPASIVSKQIRCCLEEMPPVAVKTGMILSDSTIRAISRSISCFQRSIQRVVVDPVMVATSGRRLLQKKAVHTMMDFIGNHADLVTPNLDEAQILAERKIRTAQDMENAAHLIGNRFSCWVLLKGGHLANSRQASDFLSDGRLGYWFRSARVQKVKTHGTGCVYSAAITANLARGCTLLESVGRAKAFVSSAIRAVYRFKPWMALGVHGQKRA